MSGFAALVGALWGFGLKCDDSCGGVTRWRDNPDAWQWNALGTVGLVGFACAVALLVAVAARRRGLASAAALVWCLLAVGFLGFFHESGLNSNEQQAWFGLAGAVLACVLAIASIPIREQNPLGR
jgi:hypothetical protein